MISPFITLLFFILTGLIALRLVPEQGRFLAWGSLPIVWISVLAVAGLVETVLLIPSIIPLSVLFCGMIYYLFQQPRKWPRPVSLSVLPAEFWILFLYFLGVALVAYQVHLRAPLGGWDTLFTWVLRARFLVEGGDYWQRGFSNDLALSHPDYPPMFAWALLPCWKLDGSQSSLALASLMAPFGLGWLLILVGWWKLVDRRNSWWGRITIVIILATPFPIYLFSAKSLDFVLSFSILASLAWAEYAQRKQSKTAWLACGFVVAWSALVKNEGQLWILSFLATFLIFFVLKRKPALPENDPQADLSARHTFRAIMQGMIVPVFFLIWFKLTLAPPNDLVEPQRAYEISRVIQPDVFFNPYSLFVRLGQIRQLDWHLLIWEHLWNVSFDWKVVGILIWSIPLFVLIDLYKRGFRLPWLLMAIVFQLGGYYAVYLLTPYNPYWHVSTSMNRLLMHVAPAALSLSGFHLAHLTNKAEQRSASLTGTFGYRTILSHIILSLPLLTVLFCYSQLQSQALLWNFQGEKFVHEEQISDLDFPPVSHASFATSSYDPAIFYRMQFVSVPTILVVDRREKVLLASFPDEKELKAYCEKKGWKLRNHRGGFGWAESVE